MAAETEYHRFKDDFMCAYRGNGGDIELALLQVSGLRNVPVEWLRSILKKLIKKLNK